MTDIVNSCSIVPRYRSDHSIIEMTNTISNFVTGRDISKLNNSLLKNLDYLNLINSVIEDEKIKYLLPVYNLKYIKENCDKIHLSIDDDTFSEMLFMRICGETI